MCNTKLRSGVHINNHFGELTDAVGKVYVLRRN